MRKTLFAVFKKMFLSDVSKTVIYIWSVVLSVWYSLVSLGEYFRFAPRGMDLGNYDQALWLYSRFLVPFNTVYRRHSLGDHFALTLPLLSPLYWVWNDVRALLIFQAIWISFSIIPVYKLAKLRKFSSWESCQIAIIYSIFFGIQYAIFSDFHPIVLGAGLLVWMAYFFETGRSKLFWLFLVLLLATQENMGVALVCLGVIYLFDKKYRFKSWWFIPFGILATGVAIYCTSLFSPVIGYEYWPTISWNPFENVRQLFNTANKQLSWLYSYGSFGFLTLISPGSTLAVLIDMAQYFNTGPPTMMKDLPYGQHRILLAPFLTFGLFEALLRLKKMGVRLSLILPVIMFFNVFLTIQYRFPLSDVFSKQYWMQERWMIDARTLYSRFTPDMRIAASSNLVPHVAHRQFIYVAEPVIRDDMPLCAKPCWWFDTGEFATYLFVHRAPYDTIDNYGLVDPHRSAIFNMEQYGALSVADSQGEMMLYRMNFDKIPRVDFRIVY